MNTRGSAVMTAVVVAGLLLSVLAVPALAASGPQLTVAVAALNVRGGPGTNYAIIDVLHAGDSVTATGKDASGTWYQVALTDSAANTGWLYGAYVEVSGDASSLPVVVAPPAPTAAAVSSTASVSRTKGNTIVFQESSGGRIYVMNADPQGAFGSGTNLRYLTDGMDPAISPDGKWVAFTRWSGTSTGVAGDLWVIGIDGKGERKVMGAVSQPKSPAWTNDDSTIIFNIQRGFSISPRRCIPDTFSPPPDADQVTHEGNMICFVVKQPLWRLRSVNVNTGEYQDLPGDIISYAPVLDPVAQWRVVYVGERGLVNLDITRGNTWALTNDPADRGPEFSPDGSKIAVSYWQTDHWEVHVMNADGTGDVRLTETPVSVLIDQQIKGQAPQSWNNAAPAWSPDGKQIAFLSDRNGVWEIWVMNADGSNQHLLLPASALGGQPVQYHGVNEHVISWK